MKARAKLNSERIKHIERIGTAVADLAAGATFLGAWACCTLTAGFLIGFGFGWLPAIFPEIGAGKPMGS
jgi:hypothetical protein